VQGESLVKDRTTFFRKRSSPIPAARPPHIIINRHKPFHTVPFPPFSIDIADIVQQAQVKEYRGEATLARLRRHRFIAIFFFVSFLLLLTIYFLQSRSPLVRSVFKGRFQLTQTTRIATMSAGVDAIRVHATGAHSASVIWLHGLGDSGEGWKFMSKLFDLPVHLFLSYTFADI
jgi:hypothetical protein